MLKLEPFDKVKLCPASVNTGTSSTVPLNSSSRSAVFANICASLRFELPSLTNIGTISTGLFAVADVLPSNEIGCCCTLLPAGNVAPVAAMLSVPVPSEEMVAPPRSIVSAATYKVCQRLLELPS